MKFTSQQVAIISEITCALKTPPRTYQNDIVAWDEVQIAFRDKEIIVTKLIDIMTHRTLDGIASIYNFESYESDSIFDELTHKTIK